MALRKSVVFKGISVQNAYITVVTPTIHSGNKHMSFSIQYAVDEGRPVFLADSGDCPYELEAANPVEQAYLHLKTLPEFEGCIDS